jgi:CheY-like chemotaxis protein
MDEGTRKTVLVADDELAVRRLVRKILGDRFSIFRGLGRM